jgi:geranylgeranyl pyrophosphate synthase
MTTATRCERHLDGVAQRLHGFFDSAAERAEHPIYREVWQTARAAAFGGKLLRPRLVLLAHDAFAGERRADDTDDATSLATAFELLHTAFLLHDDVIDHDLYRRGEPNVIAARAALARGYGVSTARALAYGEACSILMGDVLISGAYRLVGELDAPAGVRRALIGVVDDALFATAGGEHADAFGSLAGAWDYADIVSLMAEKTARYTFCAPLEAGALLGGADSTAAGQLARIGRELGIAFQARDDLLGVFGDEGVTGKSALSDLREGKATLLIAAAREHEVWHEASALFGNPELDEAGAAMLRAAIELTGARRRVEDFIAETSATAIAALRSSGLPKPLVAGLTDIAAGAAERVS